MIEGARWDELFGKIAAQASKGWSNQDRWRRSLRRRFAANTKATIAQFSEYATAGTDPDFNRGKYLYDREWHLLFSTRREGTKYPANPYPNPVMHPFADTGPYYCIILGPGTLDTAGGPQINRKRR